METRRTSVKERHLVFSCLFFDCSCRFSDCVGCLGSTGTNQETRVRTRLPFWKEIVHPDSAFNQTHGKLETVHIGLCTIGNNFALSDVLMTC